uniref:Uncharacterized protein n=1 Tax=Oryza barthii TaxID=65489 RepID=A0A0D3GNE2_9ORYZ
MEFGGEGDPVPVMMIRLKQMAGLIMMAQHEIFVVLMRTRAGMAAVLLMWVMFKMMLVLVLVFRMAFKVIRLISILLLLIRFLFLLVFKQLLLHPMLNRLPIQGFFLVLLLVLITPSLVTSSIIWWKEACGLNWMRFTPRSFSSNDPAILHKILYLICRKGCLKMLLDAKLFEQADSFFASSILPLAAAPTSPYARDDDVQARIHVLQQAVELRDGRLLELPADETAVPKLQQKINDYLRFYLPREIGYTPEPGLRSTMWEFAIKCDNRPYKRGNKPDIRCLLCQKLFLHADITQCMKGHLSKHCPMSTQSSLERFHIALKKEGKKKKPVTDDFEKNKRIKIGGTMPNQQGQLALINHIDSSDIDKQIDAGRKVLDKFRSCENEMCKSALEEMEQRTARLPLECHRSLLCCQAMLLLGILNCQLQLQLVLKICQRLAMFFLSLISQSPIICKMLLTCQRQAIHFNQSPIFFKCKLLLRTLLLLGLLISLRPERNPLLGQPP